MGSVWPSPSQICGRILNLTGYGSARYHPKILMETIWNPRYKRVGWVGQGVLLIWIIVGQGPTALAAGAEGVVWTFFLSSIISLFFLPLSGADGSL